MPQSRPPLDLNDVLFFAPIPTSNSLLDRSPRLKVPEIYTSQLHDALLEVFIDATEALFLKHQFKV